MMSKGSASGSAAGSSGVWGGWVWGCGSTDGEGGRGFWGGVGVAGRGWCWCGVAVAAGAVWCRCSDGGWGTCARFAAGGGAGLSGVETVDRGGGGRWATSGVVAENGWATANIHHRRCGQEQNSIQPRRSRNKHTPPSRALSLRSFPRPLPSIHRRAEHRHFCARNIHVRRRIPAQSIPALPHTFALSSPTPSSAPMGRASTPNVQQICLMRISHS